MAQSTFAIQEMVDQVAERFGRRAWMRRAELVVQMPPAFAIDPQPLLGDLDALIDRIDSMGDAALVASPGSRSVVLTIEEQGGPRLPSRTVPGGSLLRFGFHAPDRSPAHTAPGSAAALYFDQAFERTAAHPPAPGSVPPLRPLDAALQPLQRQRILAVDDNLHAMRVLLQLGHAIGLAIEPVHDGWDALRAVAMAGEAARSFSLVLLDARLPAMDAVACARQLRGHSACRAPILLMAGPGDEDAMALLAPDQPLGRSLGVVGVLRKPVVDASQLARVCLDALAVAPAGLALAPATTPVRPATAPRAATPTAPLADLPGIDTAIGRASTMNNEKLYRRLLIKFRDAQQDVPARIAEAWKAGDLGAARRLAHDLASVSGTLGAMELHLAARALESVCAGEADAAGLPAALTAAGVELAIVADGLQALGAE